MTRWDPGAEDRLREAALDLYLAHGFDSVTVTEIAERAGLTRRTFFRYFADKREVLFSGSGRIPGAVIEAVQDADENLSPIDAAFQALTVIGTRLGDYADRAGERRAVIAASPELQERERTKLAAISAALATGLRQRGADEETVTLLAPVAGAIFATAFERWIDQAGRADFADIFRDAVTEVRSALAVGWGKDSAMATPRGRPTRGPDRALRPAGRDRGAAAVLRASPTSAPSGRDHR